MKVGVLVQFTSKTDIEAKFTELKELGVDSCQLVCWDRPTLHDDVMVEKINKAIEKFGIHVTAFCAAGKAVGSGISMKAS